MKPPPPAQAILTTRIGIIVCTYVHVYRGSVFLFFAGPGRGGRGGVRASDERGAQPQRGETDAASLSVVRNEEQSHRRVQEGFGV